MKAVAVDHHGDPKPRKPKVHQPMESDTRVTKQYRLRDPVRMLFWGVSSAERPAFNTQGKHWGSLSAALRNWAEYDLQRLLNPTDGHPPKLELVEFEVVTTRKGLKNTAPPDMRGVAALEAHKGAKYKLADFAKKLVLDGYAFEYLIYAYSEGEFTMPEGFAGKMRVSELGGGFSGRPRDYAYTLAVKTKADMAMLWVALGEYTELIWDATTNSMLFEKEYPPLDASALKIKRR